MILKLFDKVLCNGSLHGGGKSKTFPKQNCAGTKCTSLKCTAGMWNVVWRFPARGWDMRLWPSPRLPACPLVGCPNSRINERLSITTDVKNPHRNWPRVLDLLPAELRKGRFVWSLRTALCDYQTNFLQQVTLWTAVTRFSCQTSVCP
jgi:hypothetical protein